MKKLLGVFIISFLIFGQPILAQTPQHDLGISGSDIYFSKNTLVVGDQIRLYGRIRNHGTEDVAGFVRFFIRGSEFVGDTQVVSVVAGGVPDEVYVDFTVPAEEFNIRAEIKGQTPGDSNPSNDVALTGMFYPKFDTDGDGIIDDKDEDDDNDGCSDVTEAEMGTDPKIQDTDGDGVGDCEDAFPNDPDRSEEEVVVITEQAETIPESTPESTSEAAPEEETNETAEEPLSEISSENEPTTDTQEENTDTTAESTISDDNDEVTQEENADVFMPKVLIDTERVNWRTYSFKPELRSFTTKNLEYSWSFGDGNSADRPFVKHTYATPGTYNVELTVTDKVSGDRFTSEYHEVVISFFNIANYQLWLATAGIVVSGMIVLKVMKSFFRRKQQKFMARSAATPEPVDEEFLNDEPKAKEKDETKKTKTKIVKSKKN